jgi:hypothetical protein
VAAPLTIAEARFILIAFVAVVLAGCSTSNGPSGNVVPSSNGPGARSAKKRRAVIHIRIPKRHWQHRAARSHYISAATKSIGIVVQAIESPSSTTLNDGPTPSSPGCSLVSGATVCTLRLELAPGDYTPPTVARGSCTETRAFKAACASAENSKKRCALVATSCAAASRRDSAVPPGLRVTGLL